MKLNIQNLTEGNHSFEFTVDDKDIHLEDYKVFKNEINIRSELEKRDKNIFVLNHVQTQAVFECDKCLVNFTVNIEDEFKLSFTSDKKYAEYKSNDEEMVQLIMPNTREIDLAAGIRDSLILTLPMRVVCSDSCKGLCPGCGINLNEATCQCINETIDLRWVSLKNLFN